MEIASPVFSCPNRSTYELIVLKLWNKLYTGHFFAPFTKYIDFYKSSTAKWLLYLLRSNQKSIVLTLSFEQFYSYLIEGMKCELACNDIMTPI